MKILAFTLVLIAAASTQESPLDKGQKFIDKIAKQWKEKLPAEQLFGVFVGRKYSGVMRMKVDLPTVKTTGSYEITLKGEMKVMNQEFKIEGRCWVDESLKFVSGESTNNEPGKTVKKKFRVDGKRWKLEKDEAGSITKTEGDVKPGMLWDATFILGYAMPDDDELQLYTPLDDTPDTTMKKGKEKVKLTIGDKAVECTTYDQIEDGQVKWTAHYDDKGKLVQVSSPANPAKLRPVSETDIGKDLKEPLQLKQYEQAIVDFYTAIKKDDKDAFKAAFDFNKYAEEMVPGFKDMKEDKKKETVDALIETTIEQTMTENLREQLPPESDMADAFSALMKSTEKDGKAVVNLGPAAFTLLKTTDEKKNTKWLIVKIASE